MAGDAAAHLLTGAGELGDGGFRLIVDNTGNPFVVVDRAGTIRYASGTIAMALGWEPGDLIGRNMVEFLPPGEVDTAVEVVQEIQQSDRTGAGIPMVFQLLLPDGRTTWVEIGSAPMLDVDGVDGIVFRTRGWNGEHHLAEFMRSLLADEPLEQTLTSLARSIASTLQSAAAVIHHGFDGTTFGAAVGGFSPAECVHVGEGPWQDTARDGEARVCLVDDLPLAVGAAARAAGFAAVWTVPVPPSDGLAPAVLSVWRTEPGPPWAGHRQAFDRTIRYVQLALVRTAEHQRLRHLAGHDALTGVANRIQFRDRLAEALAIGERDLAVAFCDLDDFKPVNDRFGHRAGDVVLVEVARRLRDALRVGDDLARMGGDEFTVLFRNVPNVESASHLVERLRGALAAPFEVGGELLSLGLSVGVVLAEPGATADELLVLADEALYEAKRAGRGQARVRAGAVTA